jgi:transposase
MGRSIGLDVHRDFCQVAIADDGRARSAGRVHTTPEQLQLFAQSLAPTDRVVMEATGNALAIARILEPHVAEVVLAHAKQVRAISHARVKTDKVERQGARRSARRGLDPGGVDR